MTDVAGHLDELRIAVGETEALAALAVESFDRADWEGADQLLVERTAYVLGVIARSAATAASRVDHFRTVVADAQPAPPSERWDYSEGRASGG